MKNFIIIGAMKAGTTTLHFLLDRHPEITMSRGKEINYFLEGDDGSVFEEKYLDNFDLNADTKVIGEASPRYTIGESGSVVADRIFKQAPETVIFYVVREPVKRMISHFAHMYRKGGLNTSFYETVKNDSSYLATSNYPYQASQYIKRFGDNVNFLDFDEVIEDPYKVARKIIGIMELEPSLLGESGRTHYNINDKNIPEKTTNPLRYKIYRFGVTNFKKFRIIPRPIRDIGKKILAGKTGIDFQSASFQKEIKAFVSENKSVLSEITNKMENISDLKLDSWKEKLASYDLNR